MPYFKPPLTTPYPHISTLLMHNFPTHSYYLGLSTSTSPTGLESPLSGAEWGSSDCLGSGSLALSAKPGRELAGKDCRRNRFQAQVRV